MAKKTTRRKSTNEYSDDAAPSSKALANLYRIAAVDQLTRLEDDPALPDADKMLVLNQVVENACAIAERLSRTAPEKAPEFWRERADRSERIYDFIRRVYGPYIGRIRRSDLRRLDFSLYQSLYYKRHKEEADLELPTAKEANDRLLAQLEGNISLAGIRNSMPPLLRQRLRLYDALASRKRPRRHSDPNR
jgi:hypothetical protein